MALEGTVSEEKAEQPPKKTPRRRTPKPDARVAEAVELARTVLAEEFPQEAIGEHLGSWAEDDRVMTHAFAASKKGYRGWEWFATLSRAPRAKEVTVCEWGLRPGAEALLAPAWIPWADRVRPEDLENQAAEEAAAAQEDPKERASAGEEPSEARLASQDPAPEAPEEEPSPRSASDPVEGDEENAGDDPEEIEDDLTAEEIEASVAVKRRGRRRRRYSTRAKKQQ